MHMSVDFCRISNHRLKVSLDYYDRDELDSFAVKPLNETAVNFSDALIRKFPYSVQFVEVCSIRVIRSRNGENLSIERMP